MAQNPAMKRGFLLLACLALFSFASAADWPQWRGPQRNGISTETINTNWPADGPKVLWRANIGIGFSSVAVAAGRAYVMGNRTNEDTIWCFDARTGREIWHYSYASQLGPLYYDGGPGATPTVEGNRVYTIGKWGDVFCLDAAKGTVIWQRDLREAGLKPNRWGYSGAPLVWKNLVFLNAGAAGTALDRATGKIVWVNGTNGAGYASPVMMSNGGTDLLLIFAAKHLIGLDPLTGRERWRQYWETSWDTNNTDPLVHQNRIFLSSFSRGCALVSLHDDALQVIYENKNLRSNLSPGVVQGDYIYAFNGEVKTDTDLRCIHLPTGEVKWSVKDPAFGSMVCANGKLVVLSEKGELLVAPASPDGFTPLVRAKVLSGLCWTPPALANGLLYAHNAKGDLVCLDFSPQH